MLFPGKSCCLGIFSAILLTRRHLCWPQLPDLSSSHLLPFNPAHPARLRRPRRGERSKSPLALLRQPFNLGEVLCFFFFPPSDISASLVKCKLIRF